MQNVSRRAMAVIGVLGPALLLAPGLLAAQGLAWRDPDPGVGAHEIVIFLHVLLFVFWLGADLGTFLSARAVVAPGRTVADRLNAAWMMSAIDLGPRIAASLMLTIGGILTEFVGIPHPPWQMAAIVLVGPFWLTLVLVAYLRRDMPVGVLAARLEFWFRCLVVPGVLVSVSYSWLTDRLADAPYVAAKLVLFAVAILLGILVQLRMRPFMAGLQRLRQAGVRSAAAQPGGPEPEMARSLARAQPLVLAIWAALAVAALLGVQKAGTPTPAPIPVAASSPEGLPGNQVPPSREPGGARSRP